VGQTREMWLIRAGCGSYHAQIRAVKRPMLYLETRIQSQAIVYRDESERPRARHFFPVLPEPYRL